MLKIIQNTAKVFIFQTLIIQAGQPTPARDSSQLAAVQTLQVKRYKE
jgi:hypothetical protein